MATPRNVRFNKDEWAKVEKFLEKNPIIETFSILARVAVLHFIGHRSHFSVQPVSEESSKIPYFMFGDGFSEAEVRLILNEPGLSEKKRHIIQKILRKARLEDVFSYLSLDDIHRMLPALRLPSIVHRKWLTVVQHYALSLKQE